MLYSVNKPAMRKAIDMAKKEHAGRRRHAVRLPAESRSAARGGRLDPEASRLKTRPVGQA